MWRFVNPSPKSSARQRTKSRVLRSNVSMTLKHLPTRFGGRPPMWTHVALIHPQVCTYIISLYIYIVYIWSYSYTYCIILSGCPILWSIHVYLYTYNYIGFVLLPLNFQLSVGPAAKFMGDLGRRLLFFATWKGPLAHRAMYCASQLHVFSKNKTEKRKAVFFLSGILHTASVFSTGNV